MENSKFERCYNSFQLYVITCVIIVTQCASNPPQVRIRSGLIRGKYVDAVNTSKVAAYLGIPYAKPPIKNLRFAAPVPMDPWPSVIQATEFGPSCIHNDDTVFPGFSGAEMWNVKNEKSEDCLHTNVWVPPGDKGTRRAVMVWIYGGSYFSGSSCLVVYDGRTMAALGDVIVVSFNYRLGPLGFLPPMGDSPGNVGFLDQLLALNWVKDNIIAFGGDPDNVSVFGESAGAASIGLHTVSPLSRGLFHRAIFQSGNQMVPWATVTPEIARERTFKLAKQLNCELSSNSLTAQIEVEVLSCLRSHSAMEVFGASWNVNELDVFQFPFVPVRETPQIPVHPGDITRRGEEMVIDIMAGFNTNEGSYFSIYILDGFNKSTKALITKDQYKDGLSKCGLKLKQIGLDAVEFFYSDWKNPDNPAQYRDAINNVISDYHIVCPTIEMAKLHKRIGNTFLFHLDYRLSNNLWPGWAGVMHGYEIELVFGLPMSFHKNHDYNDKDREVAGRMLTYWTNFAKYGNPNGEQDRMTTPSGRRNKESGWLPLSRDETRYLLITGSGDKMRSSYNSFQCAFWENYIPRISAISSDWDDQEVMWKSQFHRWQSSMDEWEEQFSMTSKSRKRNCGK